MTQYDPRDPLRSELPPSRDGEGRRADLDMPADPRLARGTANNWGLIGGLAAVLVLGLVIFSMMGGNPGGETTTAPTQTSTPAPAQRPAPDPMATGTTRPPEAVPPVAPAPTPATPAPAPAAPRE